MTIRPPGPDDPPGPDELAGRRASLAALWALALERFRDYLHWAAPGSHWVSEAAQCR